MAQPASVHIDGVTKRFDQFVAVDHLSLRVEPGELCGFLGPNGAGKTTTIRMIMSILYPDAGQIRVLGSPRAIDVKDRIGYLPEERGLYRRSTVHQILRYLGILKGIPRRELNSRIAAQLERVGLSAWRNKRVDALSKGMQQKIQFAATILHDPELIILDEPFSGLDPLNADLLRQLMLDLRARGRTVIFSTHELESAEQLCDRIVLINRGRTLVDDTPANVRGRFAARMVTIDGDSDLQPLTSAPGVRQAQHRRGQVRLELTDDGDPQALLRQALTLGPVTRFELHRPSLREIFVKLVGDDQGPARNPETDARQPLESLASQPA